MCLGGCGAAMPVLTSSNGQSCCTATSDTKEILAAIRNLWYGWELLYRPLFFSRGFRFCQFLEVVTSQPASTWKYIHLNFWLKGVWLMTFCFCWIIADSKKTIHMLFAFLFTLITLLHVLTAKYCQWNMIWPWNTGDQTPTVPNGITNSVSGLEGKLFKNPSKKHGFIKKIDFPTQPIESDSYGMKVMNPLHGGCPVFSWSCPKSSKVWVINEIHGEPSSPSCWSLSFCWWIPLKNNLKN